MHRPTNPTTTLALTALIMAAGTSAHAQFQFLMDQPLNPSETGRRGGRSEDGYYAAQRPAQRTYAAPEPERKGFFGRLFSRDEEPPRYQAQPGNYAQPGTTYARDGVRYSDPAGYYQAPAPAITPQWQQNQPAWPQAQPVAPQYTPQGYANPQWSQPANPQPGVVTSYPIGADPAANYAAPAARPAATTSPRALPADAFTGQRATRSDYAAPMAAAPSYPTAQPQWPQAQPVAPQYTPQGYATPSWPAQPDPRVIGSQAVAPAATAVVPPTGSPRPLTTHVVSDGVRYAPGAVPQGYAVPEGYPVPEPRYQSRSESLDRPGFFSRLFGRGSREEAPTRNTWSGPAQNYQPQPVYSAPAEYDQRSRYPQSAPPASSSFGQDPFSGQRPARRSNEYVPEVPQNFFQPPQPPPAARPAPRGSLDSPPGAAPFAPPASVSPAEARAFSPLDA